MSSLWPPNRNVHEIDVGGRKSRPGKTETISRFFTLIYYTKGYFIPFAGSLVYFGVSSPFFVYFSPSLICNELPTLFSLYGTCRIFFFFPVCQIYIGNSSSPFSHEAFGEMYSYTHSTYSYVRVRTTTLALFLCKHKLARPSVHPSVCRCAFSKCKRKTFS